MTVYVDCEEVQRRIKELELQDDAVLAANKGTIHQALLNVAFDHPDEVAAEVRRLAAGDDE
jgi:hypothetical protein